MIDEETKGLVVQALPNAMRRALNSYRRFLKRQKLAENESLELAKRGEKGKTDPLSPTEFQSHHAACRMAIAHIELLFKLAKTVGDEYKEQPDSPRLKVMLATAQLALNESRESLEQDPADDKPD